MIPVKKQRFFESGEFSKLALLEAGHFWFEERNRLLAWCIKRYFSNLGSFCEVGSGTGFVALYIRNQFPGIRLACAEYFTEGIQIARQRLPQVQFVRADARYLPFRNGFDLIGAFDVIEHIEEDELVLSEFHQALRAHGGLILTVPQHRFLWSITDERAHHKRRYERKDLVGKVRRAGFRVVRCTSFITTLLPCMIASRLVGRERSSEESASREFQLSATINGIFRACLTCERFLIRAGISLPCGGSLLVVAVKPE